MRWTTAADALGLFPVVELPVEDIARTLPVAEMPVAELLPVVELPVELRALGLLPDVDPRLSREVTSIEPVLRLLVFSRSGEAAASNAADGAAAELRRLAPAS